jgi:hydrogenase nickel incorporation protein HypA/HybF
VTVVQLRVGHLRQVVPGALAPPPPLITQNTIAERAVLAIETIAVVARCHRCGAETEQPEFPLQCRTCSAFDIEIIAGEELEIDWVEVEEEEQRHELQA